MDSSLESAERYWYLFKKDLSVKCVHLRENTWKARCIFFYRCVSRINKNNHAKFIFRAWIQRDPNWSMYDDYFDYIIYFIIIHTYTCLYECKSLWNLKRRIKRNNFYLNGKRDSLCWQKYNSISRERNFCRNKFIVLSDLVRKESRVPKSRKRKGTREKMSSIGEVHCQNSSEYLSPSRTFLFLKARFTGRDFVQKKSVLYTDTVQTSSRVSR